jgi:hypothetical protein
MASRDAATASNGLLAAWGSGIGTLPLTRAAKISKVSEMTLRTKEKNRTAHLVVYHPNHASKNQP